MEWTKDGEPVDSSNTNYYLTTIAAERSLTILKVNININTKATLDLIL